MAFDTLFAQVGTAGTGAMVLAVLVLVGLPAILSVLKPSGRYARAQRRTQY